MPTINWSHAIVVDTAGTMLETNPVLLENQVGLEQDSKLFKIGDGTTAWVDLPYAVINGQQSVWMGASSEADNLISRSSEDGGLVLRSSLFLSAQEHIDTINSNTALDLLDVSAPLKAAVYRISVLTRSVINAMGTDFANLKTASYAGTTVQQRISAVVDQVTAVQGLIDDNVTTAVKTWSSNHISATIMSAVNSALSGLIGSAPEALNTIYELAAVLGENQNLVTTISQDLGSTVRFTVAQALTVEQKLQARDNIGAASATYLGLYSEINDQTLVEHFEESLGQAAPAETLVGEVLTRLESVELRVAMSRCSMAKTDYDASTGQYLTVTWRRYDGSIAVRSTMSNPSATGDGTYSTRTEQYYASNGITVLQTVTYQLVYDSNLTVVSENISSIV